MRRLPAVAGQFYPEVPDLLRRTVDDLLVPNGEPTCAVGVVSPHAGYIYSGMIAGETFARVSVPERVIILGPNHHGVGHPGAVYASGSWVTPLKETSIDNELAEAILSSCPALVADEAAHRHEHSLEVQLPFIQACAPDTAIVPICLGHARLDDLLRIGDGLAEAVAASPVEVLLVASSDMTHYESADLARAKDQRALERVLAVDPEGLYRTVVDGGISMCGVIPVTVMLAAARRLGATGGTLVRYGNSGEVTGDQSQVVGYAGVVIAA